MEIAVTSGALATLVEEADRQAPNEACGILLGMGDHITLASPCANIHPDPMRHFEIDPQALIDAHRAARQGGLQVVGYYHSHPQGQPHPSATDQAMAHRDASVWAIVVEAGVTFWRDGQQGFEALSYRVLDG